MATATKAAKAELKVPEIKQVLVTLGLRSKSTLVQHNWDEKSIKMMRDKHAGQKTKKREVRNPEAEGEAAAYRCEDGRYGIRADAIKAAIITAAHKDIGIEKTLVRKALFIRCDDRNNCIPITYETEPEIREDTVRVGQGSTDLRYRPYFTDWKATIQVEMDAELLQVEDLVRLLNRAGFGVGIGEMRPEKGKDYGRFEVDPDVAWSVEAL